MNVYCVKDNTLMVQREEYFTCMLCEHTVRLDFDGLCKE